MNTLIQEDIDNYWKDFYKKVNYKVMIKLKNAKTRAKFRIRIM